MTAWPIISCWHGALADTFRGLVGMQEGKGVFLSQQPLFWYDRISYILLAGNLSMPWLPWMWKVVYRVYTMICSSVTRLWSSLLCPLRALVSLPGKEFPSLNAQHLLARFHPTPKSFNVALSKDLAPMFGKRVCLVLTSLQAFCGGKTSC